MSPINTLTNAHLFMMVQCFLCMIVMGVISPFFIIFQQTKVLIGDPEINYEISNGMRLIGAIFIILHLSFLITLTVVMTNFNNMITDIKRNNCTDTTTIMVFEYVYDSIHSAYSKNIACLVIVAIVGVCELISSTILLCIARKIR